MRGGDFERDDVYTLTDAVDVARVGRIPQRSDVPLVGFRGEEKLEGDVGGRGRVGEEGVRLVVRSDVCSQVAGLLRQLLVCVVLLGHVLDGRRWDVGLGVDGIGIVKADAAVVFPVPEFTEALWALGQVTLGSKGGFFCGGQTSSLEGSACEGGRWSIG